MEKDLEVVRQVLENIASSKLPTAQEATQTIIIHGNNYGTIITGSSHHITIQSPQPNKQ